MHETPSSELVAAAGRVEGRLERAQALTAVVEELAAFPAEQWQPGRAQFAFDKQFLRDWAAGTGWDKRPPAPEVPPEIVDATRQRYVEAYELLTGSSWV